MKKFYVTFGQGQTVNGYPVSQYYLELNVISLEDAYAIVKKNFGDQFSEIYCEEDFQESKHLYPKGRLNDIILPLNMPDKDKDKGEKDELWERYPE